MNFKKPIGPSALASGIIFISSSAWAAEPDLQPRDTFTYSVRGKSVAQQYVGQTGNGEHQFKIGNKTFC